MGSCFQNRNVFVSLLCKHKVMEEKARFNVKYMEEMKLYTHEEMLDRVIGTKVLQHAKNMRLILITFL